MVSVLKLMFTVGLVVALTLIIIELIVSKIKGKRVYTLADTLTNLSSGMIERSFDVFCAVGFFFLFNYIYQMVPWKIPANPLTWFIALLVTDFLAYWHHRLSHEINFLWAAHIVHHQSEELNVTTVFRVSFFAVLNRALFFVWMPLMGFDPITIATTIMFLGIYQFLTHYRFVGKLGFLEKFMTTPSHHRVHHSRNEKYLDKNYGHIFIFWDKLLGTFKEEEEEPDYGITSGFESSNPFKAQFSYWKNLFTRAKRTKSVKNKVKVFLKDPTYTPEDSPHLPPEYKTDENGNRIQYRNLFSLEESAYILLSVLTTFSFFFLLTKLIVPKPEGADISIEQATKYVEEAYEFLLQPFVLIFVGLILLSIYIHGLYMDRHKYAFIFELVRYASIVLVVPMVLRHMTEMDKFNLTMTDVESITNGIFAFVITMFLWLVKIKVLNKSEVKKHKIA